MSTFEPAMQGKLTDRLRGKYPIGPVLPSGEPEFGYRVYDSTLIPPIQFEAAEAIERLKRALFEIVSIARTCGGLRDDEIQEIAEEAILEVQ